MHAGFARRKVPVAMFLAAMVAFMVALLHGPAMPLERARALCVVNLQLAKSWRLLLNCDSPDFLRLAYNPIELMEPGEYRLSRPVFIVAASVLGRILEPVVSPLQILIPQNVGPNQRNGDKVAFGLRNYLPVFAGYVFINLLLLVFSFIIYFDLVEIKNLSHSSRRILCYIGILLICNIVTKGFIWSAHTQIFNILIPVAGTAIMANSNARSWPRLLGLSLLIGLGILAYAANAILLLCLLLAEWRRAQWHLVSVLPRQLAALAATIVLPVGWSLYCTIVLGGFAVPEATTHRESVWILDARNQGIAELVYQIGQRVDFFLEHGAWQAIPAAAALLAIAISVRLDGSAGFGSWAANLRPKAEPALLASLVCLIFYIIIGWPAARLAYAVVPPLIICAGFGVAEAARMAPGHDLGWRVEAVIAAIVLTAGVFFVMLDRYYS